MHALRLVSTSPVSNRRQAKRCVLERRTSARLWLGGQGHDCVIEDISLGGARLRFEGSVPDGPDPVLEHAVAGRFPGRLAWIGEGVAGFQFDGADEPLQRELQCIALMVASDDTQAVRRPVA